MEIKAYTEILNRFMLASALGMQFGGDRDLYAALGYPTSITFADYYARYKRQDIAKAIINRPIAATWKGVVAVSAPADKTDEVKESWEKLEKRLSLKAKFSRVDRLSSLGRFGCLMLGFSDVKDVNLEMPKPVVKSKALNIDYVVPLSEGSVEIQAFVEDVTDVRFGLPLTYKVQIVTGGNKSKYLIVHHTRMIHITGELIDEEVYGVPALEPVWNRLMDLEKLVGGSAEMYWKGARPGYTGNVDKDIGISADLQEEMKAQMEEYEHGLRRFLIGKGLDIQSLAPQVSDPTNHVEVQIQMISAVTGIPKRILTGSERGELASSQDKEAWNALIMARREEFAEAQIIKPFTERMMEYGILPKRDSYTTEWESLYVVSDKDKADVGRIRAQSLKDYTMDVQEIMPPEAFFRHVLNLTDDVIDEIWVIQDEEVKLDNTEI